jgi:hypothetical protein
VAMTAGEDVFGRQADMCIGLRIFVLNVWVSEYWGKGEMLWDTSFLRRPPEVKTYG